MKQKYLKPAITVHTIQLSLMAASGTDVSSSKPTTTVDNGEELGSKHFDFLDEE